MSFNSLFKTFTKTISITGLGISSLVTFTSPIKAENFNMKACPEPGSANANLTYIANTLNGECLHTPDQYKLTIYEMGLCTSDPISTAKILTNFSKTNKNLKIVAGYMDGKVLDENEVAIIATLPSLEEARAKIVGILSSPAQKLVSILLAPGSKIANLARAKGLKN